MAIHRTNPVLYHYFTEIYFIVVVFIEFFGNILNNLGIPVRRQAKLPESLADKVVVITGGNAGIGKKTAEILVRRGAKVIIGCRDMNKGQKVVEEITAKLAEEDKRSNLVLFELNLASLQSVRAFAKKVQEKVTKIDVLINNAGVMACPEWKTVDGYEMQFGTNHLGHFLLTHLLIDELKSAKVARIVNVAAATHLNGSIDFDNINMTGVYDARLAYSRSKLANLLFTRSLAKKLEGTNVTAYSLHPGIIRTELGRHITNIVMQTISRGIFIDMDYGSQTTLHCAFEEGIEKHSGHYFK